MEKERSSMASQSPNQRHSLYPEVEVSNPDASSPFISKPNPNHTTSSLYPSIDVSDLVEDLFPDNTSPTAPPVASEDVLIKVPGAILHLIDQQYSFELAIGDLTIIRLRQVQNTVAVYARVGNEIQWPLAKDEAIVKVDESHYFFCFRVPKEEDSDSSDEEEGDRRGSRRKGEDKSGLLSYGLTIASKGQENLLKDLDHVLKDCSNFSVEEVSDNAKKKGEALDGSVAMEISPLDLKTEKEKKELMEKSCAAYWTTLAPNVEDYSGTAARLIAAGSGQLVKGVLWCGDVTVERLRWGNEFMKKRMGPPSQAEISPQTLKRIKRFANLIFVLLNFFF